MKTKIQALLLVGVLIAMAPAHVAAQTSDAQECDPDITWENDGSCVVPQGVGPGVDDCDEESCPCAVTGDPHAIEGCAGYLTSYDAAALPDAWAWIDFKGGCDGWVSTTEFEAEASAVEIDTPLVDIKLLTVSVAVEKLYYKVTCGVDATPKASGEYGFIRTVWVEEDGIKVDSCFYQGTPGQDSCPEPAVGTMGVAGSTPMVGSLEDGRGPEGAKGCWVGPSIRASNVGYQGIDSVSSPVDELCATLGIKWNDPEGTVMTLQELIDQTLQGS